MDAKSEFILPDYLKNSDWLKTQPNEILIRKPSENTNCCFCGKELTHIESNWGHCDKCVSWGDE